MVGYRNFLGLSVCLSERYRKVLTMLSYPPFYRCRMFVCHTDAEQWSYRAGLPPFYFSCVYVSLSDRYRTVLLPCWVTGVFFGVISVCLSDRYWTELLPCWVTGEFFVISLCPTDTGQNSYRAGLPVVSWCRRPLHGPRPGRTPASWCPGSSHSVPWWRTCRKLTTWSSYEGVHLQVISTIKHLLKSPSSF